MAVELLVMRHLQLFAKTQTGTFVAAVTLIVWLTIGTTRGDDLTPPAGAAPPTAAASTAASSTDKPSDASPVADPEAAPTIETPWDFSPYRVQVWIASDDLRVTADRLAKPLAEYLDRDFASIWRLNISDAPLSVRAAASRGLEHVTYDSITSADPVVALKRNHVDAPRIRFIADVATYVKKCYATSGRIAEVTERGKAAGNEGLSGAAKLFEAIEGDSLAVAEKWSDPTVEAIITNRGMAKELKDPPAKLISLPIDNLAAETIEASDKLFIVHVETTRLPWTVSVIELDCLMRNFSVVHQRAVTSPRLLVSVMGQAITEVFAPLIRIEDAGAKNAKGLVRAYGLITDEKSPASVAKDDFFVPMTRKNDRNGDPIQIGPLDWAFLHVKEVNGAKLEMDYHAGKAGGLQGRQNKRTFRTGTRVRPFDDSTTVRLHVQRNPTAPLVGYEIYERGLSSTEMNFVGRTDWDGRIEIPKSDMAMRLLYVKNGGAVLARLPVVPGQSDLEVADLFGDDQRLRAEAYIRGTQNSIVDLVAIRQLFAARIRMRLAAGELKEAKELLETLRNEPSYEKIAGDMGRKLLQLKGRNSGEQAKIDRMFAQTREMLVKNISPALIRELEEAVMAAEKGAPPKPATPPSAADTAANESN
jgi:hypothetical protein